MADVDIDEVIDRIAKGEKLVFSGIDAVAVSEAIRDRGRIDIVVDRSGGDIRFQAKKNVVSVARELEYPVEGKARLFLPQDGTPIGGVAEVIGRFYNGHRRLFYDAVQREVVRLDNIGFVRKKDKKAMQAIGFVPMDKDSFITYLENDFEVGRMVRSRFGDEEFVQKSMNGSIAQAILKSSDQFRASLPIIRRIFAVPKPILQDGTLRFPKKGYDEELQSWLLEDAPNVRMDMPLEDAKSIIAKVLKEFCFREEQDRTNAIAGILTPFCRGLYENETACVPVFFYIANRERAGKDYLAGITGILYEGAPIEDPEISNEHEVHDEEFRKRILSTCRIGRTRMHCSNNKGFLNSAELEGVVTKEFITDRQLGSSTMLTYPKLLEISLSANLGITYTADLSKRCIFINLFFAEEDPNQRRFETPDLQEWVAANRDSVLSALFAFIRTWVEKGMPAGSKPFASFHEWARVVGGIMETCGYDSPIPNENVDAIGGDRENADMKLLYELAYKAWPEQEILASTIFNELQDPEKPMGELFGWIDWKDARKAKMRIGKMIRARKNRIYSDIKLEVFEDASHSIRDRFKFTRNLQGQLGLDTLDTLDTSTSRSILQDKNIVSNGKSIQSIRSVQNSNILLEKQATSSQDARAYIKSIIMEELEIDPEMNTIPIGKYTKTELKAALEELQKSGDVERLGPGKFRLVRNDTPQTPA